MLETGNFSLKIDHFKFFIFKLFLKKTFNFLIKFFFKIVLKKKGKLFFFLNFDLKKTFFFLNF